MPKAKPKTPKTEKMWMAWYESEGFIPSDCGFRREDVDGPAIPVRIMPEAKYQRLRKAAKGGK